MPVEIIRVEPRCKICVSPHNKEIDALIELRKKGASDPVTKRKLTLAFTLEIFGGRFGLHNPTKENYDTHTKRHRKYTNDVEQAQVELYEKDVAKHLSRKYEKEGFGGVDTYARRAVEVAEMRMQLSLRSGRLPQVSMEQALKAVDTTTRRKQSDAQQTLVHALTAGIGQAIGRSVVQSPGALDEVIEAEIVSEIEEGDGKPK
jgi:hypothetical protein